MYPDEVPPLPSPQNNRSSSNIRRKPPRYQSASCRNYGSLVARASVHLWPARLVLPFMVFPGSPTSPFLPGGILLLYAESRGSWRAERDNFREIWGSAGGRTLAAGAYRNYDNCDRLIAQTCRSISWGLPSLVARAYKWPWQE